MENKKVPVGLNGNLTVCFLEGCPWAAKCVRRLSYEQFGNGRHYGSAVHPSSLREDGCDMFSEAKLKRFAKGATHLYDEVRMKHYASIRHQVIRILHGRDIYYRCLNGKRLITESEQLQIRHLFAAYDYPVSDLFDEYVELYE